MFMRSSMKAARLSFLLAAFIVGCGSDPMTDCCTDGATKTGIRVVNGFTTPVEVAVDGRLVIPLLGAGAIDTVATEPGRHLIDLHTGGSAASAQWVEVPADVMRTVVSVRNSSGIVSAVTLDDTSAVITDGLLRVLNLAPNAGELQAFYTQPGYSVPLSVYAGPLAYQTGSWAPFIGINLGDYEVRVWQTPADSSGWESAAARMVVPLAEGEKATVVVFDRPGGGVRLERF